MQLDGDVLYQDESDDYASFIKQAYKALDVKYPKFFKMDALSKLALVAADVVLKKHEVSPEQEQNIAIVFSNKVSSLDTDTKHQQSIQHKDNYYPSPAVFVYTLPNICVGEISIKYKLYSENSFFIFDTFNAPHLHAYSKYLLEQKKADKVLCGWVDVEGDNYNAFCYLVTPEGQHEHTIETLNRLYNN